jgi:hypothetical protein
MIRKMLVSTAIVIGSFAVGVAPANAEPNPNGTQPNPFSSLTCNCQEPAPAGSSDRAAQIERGIRSGLSSDDIPQHR